MFVSMREDGGGAVTLQCGRQLRPFVQLQRLQFNHRLRNLVLYLVWASDVMMYQNDDYLVFGSSIQQQFKPG